MTNQNRYTYVVEVSPAINSAGDTKTFLFSWEGWATKPTDSPSNTLVLARLDQPGNIRMEMYSGNRTVGEVRPTFGECTLINSDGYLDEFANYGFDGREFVVRYGLAGDDYPSNFITILKATLRGAVFDMQRVRLVVRDRMELLDRPLSQTTFLGTGNEEGTAELTGTRKPVSFGRVRSVRPQLLNQSSLLYSVGLPSPGKWNHALYVTDGQGTGLTPAWSQSPNPLGLYANSVTELLSATINPGAYWTCPSLGLVRLGSQPAIDLTCSVKQTVSNQAWSGTETNKLGTILKEMAEMAGITNISEEDVANVNSSRSDNIYGYHISDDETCLSAMSNIASSASVWFGMGVDDVLHMGVFSPPFGTPSIVLNAHNMLSVEKLDGGDTNKLVPVWRVTAQCSCNYAEQTSFAGSCPEWFRVWYRKKWPGSIVVSNTVKTKHPFADEITVSVYGGEITGDPNVDGGAALNALQLYGVERELLSIEIPFTTSNLSKVGIGSTVLLKFPRYGWDNGKLFNVVATDINMGSQKITITVWG